MEENEKVKAKKASIRTSEWMNQKPNPLPLFIRGQSVQVYRGAGWSSGNVVDSRPSGCVVKLKQTQQDVRVYDARCIRPT